MTDDTCIVNEESTLLDNVAPINGKGRKTKKEAKKKEPVDDSEEEKEEVPARKPDPVELYETIFQAVTGDTAVLDPAFPLPEKKIIATDYLEGVGAVEIEGADGIYTAKRLDEKSTIRFFAKYCRMLGKKFSFFYQFTPGKNIAVHQYWSQNVELSPTPVPLLFRSKPGTAFHRLDFDPSPGECPIWLEFLSRITNGNADAVEAWLGSFFFPEAYRQQYLWIQGEGNDGKGAFVRLVHAVLGAANCLNLAAPPGEDKHESIAFVGKLALIFPDFENFGSLDTTFMKMLTGGDDYPVRPMGKAPYNTPSTWSCLFTSNRFPNLTDTKANQRRPIFVSIRSYGGREQHIADYDARLYAERAAIIDRCMAAYSRLCPTFAPIPVSEDSVETLAGDAGGKDDKYLLWMSKEKLQFTTSTLFKDMLQPAILEAKILEGFKDYSAQQACRDFLKRKGVIRKKISRAVLREQAGHLYEEGKDTRPNMYHGIRDARRDDLPPLGFHS